MEGPEPSKLDKITFISPTQVTINRTNYWGGKSLSIRLVDIEKGVAVFTFGPTKAYKEGYQILMVDVSKAHLFPVVVNYCPTDKQAEYVFDKVDFKSLLK